MATRKRLLYTAKPGIRFRVHSSRTHTPGSIKKDRYFTLRFTYGGKSISKAIGWDSDYSGDALAESVLVMESIKSDLRRFQKNIESGKGPTSVDEQKALIEKTKAEQEKASITFDDYFNEKYLPIARNSKKASSFKKELQHHSKWLSPTFGNKPDLETKVFPWRTFKPCSLDLKIGYFTVALGCSYLIMT